MRKRAKYFFCVFLLFFVFYNSAQNSTGPQKNKKSKTRTTTERTITREELLKVKKVRELVPAFPEHCNILNWELIGTTRNGSIKIFSNGKGADISEFLGGQDWGSIYISLKSTCTMEVGHSFKVIVKKP